MSAAPDPREDVLGKAYDARLVRRLAAFARPYAGLVAASLALLFAGGGVQLLQPWLVKVAIDEAIVPGRPDALAAVDADTEKAILGGLGARASGRTVILITHRLSTLAGVDRIVVVEGGRVVEDGTHSELSRRSARYRSLLALEAAA